MEKSSVADLAASDSGIAHGIARMFTMQSQKDGFAIAVGEMNPELSKSVQEAMMPGIAGESAVAHNYSNNELSAKADKPTSETTLKQARSTNVQKHSAQKYYKQQQNVKFTRNDEMIPLVHNVTIPSTGPVLSFTESPHFLFTDSSSDSDMSYYND